MVGFGGGELLLWRAVNIDCCRLESSERGAAGEAANRDSGCDSPGVHAASALAHTHTQIDAVACVQGRSHCSSVCGCVSVSLPSSVSLCGGVCVYKVVSR